MTLREAVREIWGKLVLAAINKMASKGVRGKFRYASGLNSYVICEI